MEQKVEEKKEGEVSAEEQEKARLRAALDELDGPSVSALPEDEPDELPVPEQEAETPGAPPVQTGDGGAVKPEEPKPTPTTDFAAELEKLKGQVVNLNKALGEERQKRREAEASRNTQPPASGDVNANIDPDTAQTLDTWYSRRKEQENAARIAECEADLLESGVDRADYEDATRYFLNASAADPKLQRRWLRAGDPVQFAYEEGKKIRESVKPSPDKVVLTKAELEAQLAAARQEGQKVIAETVRQGTGIIPSLSQAAGSTREAKKSALRKELDEL